MGEERLDIFDLFNPREHPRDGNGRFATKWGTKAVGAGVQRNIEAKLSPESREYLGRVHQAAEGRRTLQNRVFSEAKRDPKRNSPAFARSIASLNLANAELCDLLGRSLVQPRSMDIDQTPEASLTSIKRPGTSETLQQYMGELSNSMGELRRSLGAMPNQWEVDGEKPGAMTVSVGVPGQIFPADLAADITESLQETYAYAVQLTGFQVDSFQTSWQGLSESVNGSHYDPRDRRIGLAPRVTTSSGSEREFLHEFAHLADDDNPEMGKAGGAWLKARSHDGELKDLKGPNHVGYQDAFVDPYVGRVYPAPIKYDPNDPDADLTAILDLDLDTDLEQIQKRGAGTTELLSVGLEYFATPGGMAKLYSVDPDHFNFVVEQILNAKRRGIKKDSIPDGNPLATILTRIILKVDPAAIAPEWSEADILSEGRAVVSFLVEDYRAGVLHQDAAAPPRLPEEDAIAAYFSQVLHQIEPSIDLADWEPYDIIGEAEAALDVLIDLHHERSLVDLLSQPEGPVVPKEEAGYLDEHWNPATVCAGCFAYAGGTCQVVQGEISPAGGCDLWESRVEAVSRIDDNQAVQKVLDWHGLKLGIQYLPGDRRHERTLTAAYGHVRGTYGQSDDGMALDVWVNLKGAASDRCFKLQQLTQDGEHDEEKYILGVESVEAAQALYTANMPRKLMGTVKECAIAELRPRRGDAEFDESETARDGKGRFAKKSSRDPVTMPLPVGNKAQRNAPFDAPGSLFATSLTQGNSYCRATPQQTNAFIKENRIIAKSSAELLRTASLMLGREIEDLQIKSREALDEDLKALDDGIPYLVAELGINDDYISAYEVYQKDGIDAAIAHYRKIEEGKWENGNVPDDFLSLGDDDLNELLGPDDDDDALDLSDDEDFDFNPGDLDNLFGDQPDFQDDPTMASVREENNRALMQSKMDAVAKLDAAIAKSSVTHSLKEAGDVTEEAIEKITDDSSSNYGKLFARMTEAKAKREEIADARSYFNDVYSVIGTTESMPAYRIRTTENSNGEILQVAALAEGSQYISYLGSSAMSAPAKYKKTLAKSVDMLKGDDSGATKYAVKVVETALNTPPPKTKFASGIFLEGLITELSLRDGLGDIGCTPMLRNKPLFARAGFKDDVGMLTGGMTLSAKDAEKFWRMRQAIAQRKDSMTFLDDAIAWDRELAELEAELGPMMCSDAATELEPRADAKDFKPKRDKTGRFAKNASAKIELFDPAKLAGSKVVGSLPASMNRPSVIEIDGKQYVSKKTRGAVSEAVGSAIAKAANVPHVHAVLVDRKPDYLDKGQLISEKVEGFQDVKALPALSEKLGDIHAHWELSGKYSAPKAYHLGAFSNMLKHPDLAKISALDTFTGNTDRTKANLMYNAETGGYMGVDMEDAFVKDERRSTIGTPGEEALSDGEGYVHRTENIAQLLEGSSDEELDRQFDGKEIDTYVSTLDTLHQTLDAKAVTGLLNDAARLEAKPDAPEIHPTVGTIHSASARTLSRLKDYQAWRAKRGDRADGLFNWKESDRSRDENGRFAQKPSAKNRISYVGDEQRIKHVKVLADEMGSVHTLPSIVKPEQQQSRVIVSVSPHPREEAMGGQYSPEYGNEISIWTPPANFTKGNTFVHEYGHHVDSVLNMNKEVRPYSFASFKTSYAAEYLEMFGDEIDPYVKRVMEEDVENGQHSYRPESTIREIAEYNPDAARRLQFISDSGIAVSRIMGRARNSKELSQLRDAVTQGYTELPNGLRKECDRTYAQYLLNPTEVFARSYAQWVATRGLSDTTGPDNPKSFEAFGEQMVLGSRIYPTTWGHDNFSDIHNGFEDGFSDLGLIKGEAKYRL